MNCRLRDVEETHRDENGVITRSVSFEAALVFFLLRQVGWVKKNCKQIQRDGPSGQHQEFVESPVDLSVPPECYPPLQNQQQQGRDGKDNVDLIERVFSAPVKRAPSSREQISYPEADDDRHQRRDELEAAHEVLCVLHDVPRLMGIEPENLVANGWIYSSARVIYGVRGARFANSQSSPLFRLASAVLSIGSLW